MIRTRTLVQKITAVLVQYAKSQLLIMSIVTVISWIALSLLQVRFALLLAVITGALSVVPVLGMLTSAGIAGLVAVFDGSRFLNGPAVFEGVALLLVYVILNVLIDTFLSPYLIGKMSTIHPLILFLGVLVSSAAFGIPGAVLVIPFILVVRTVIDHYT